MKDADNEKNADPRKDRICRWECMKVHVKAKIPHTNFQYTLAQYPGQQLRKTHIVRSQSGGPILSVGRHHSGVG